MLELKHREHAEPNPQVKTAMDGSVDKLPRVLRFAKLGKRKRHGCRLRDQIGAMEGQIDQCVYKLYNLTEGEIKTVEGVG
jgi:hypothetical protein